MFAPANVEKVIRHLVRFGSSHAEAEDLAQDALLIAWRKKHELDGARSIDAWLFGIARNVYRNHARSVRRSPMSQSPDAPIDRPAPATSIADVLSLRDALHALPENQQDIVILHELEEYTLKETAELLEIPFDTAKDRLRRAREILRGAMREDLAIAAEAERRDTRPFSTLAAAGVLAGFVGLLASSGSAAAAGALAATEGAGTVAATAARTVWLSKAAIGAALLATGVALGVVGDRTLSPRGESPTAPGVATREPRPDASVVVAATPPDAAPRPDAPRDEPRTPVRADRDPDGPGANPEAQVIERARTALARGRADDALRTLMSHERRFPDGQLAEERDVLLIDAYVATGNLRLARARVEQYQATYPTSIHRTKVAETASEIERRIAGSASP